MTRGIESRRARVAAWRVMRALTSFTADDLEGGAGMTHHAARTLIRKLLAAGRIEHVESRQVGRINSYEVYRVRPGTTKMPLEIDGIYYWQIQAWTAMRWKRAFRPADLIPAMEDDLVDLRTLRRWCKALANGGFLRQAAPTRPGRETPFQMISEQPEPPHVEMTKKLDGCASNRTVGGPEVRNEC